ncbi:hypothetical protein FIBSPDRAFT_762171, partial [Athelia psychrophila]
VQVYVDGSRYKGGISAAAVLYEGTRVIAVRRCYLGKLTKYTVHNGGSIGVIMGLHLLLSFTRRLRGPTIIGCDNQAVLRGLTNQKLHSGHYLLDSIHDLEECLHAKQDTLARRAEQAIAIRNGEEWTPRRRGVVDLQLHWVPGHKDFEPNERADCKAKKAAEKLTSPMKDLPVCLRKVLPFSVAALRQENTAKLKRTWTKRWRKSPRNRHFGATDKSTPSTKFLKLIDPYSCKQVSIITQFRTNHVPLNQTLFRIGRVESPACPHCGGITIETIHQFILDCPHHEHACHMLCRKLGRKAGEIPFLLGDSTGIKEFLSFVHTTKHLKL